MHCVTVCFVIRVPLLLISAQLFGRLSSRVLNVECPAARASWSLMMGIDSSGVCAAGCEEARYVGE